MVRSISNYYSGRFCTDCGVDVNRNGYILHWYPGTSPSIHFRYSCDRCIGGYDIEYNSIVMNITMWGQYTLKHIYYSTQVVDLYDVGGFTRPVLCIKI